MTIREFLDSLPTMASDDGTTFKDAMMDTISIWSEEACKGYCIDAMQRAGIPEDDIQRVLDELRCSLCSVTAEEAAEIYRNF